MKKIKIFLASSITDLAIDRLEFGDFIRQLNDVYIDRGIYFSLIKCEDYDSAISLSGKQTEFDREILDSELVFFLFFHKIGEYTRHEFDIALDAYRAMGKPRIVTYFKGVKTAEDVTAEVNDFMALLDGEIKHYYSTYQSIDTLKLGVLMQIKLMKLDQTEPTVENGKIYFGGVEIADTEKIPLFAGNAALEDVRAELARTTKRYYALQEKYFADRADMALYRKYCEIASRKAELEEKLRLAEKKVLEVASDMTEKTAAGNLSPRQIAAYRALEKGDYDGALEILDFDEIMDEIEHNKRLADTMKARLQVNVNELKQRIAVLTADGIEANEIEEITRLYETACNLAEEYHLDKGVLYDFAAFLKDMNDLKRARDVAQKLMKYYELDSASDFRRANLANLLANIHALLHDYDEAERHYSIALTGFEKLAARCEGERVGAYDGDIAMVCHNLGVLYSDLHRYHEAETHFLRALEIRKRLAEEKPEIFEEYLAGTHNCLGILYGTNNHNAQAEEHYVISIEIIKRLVEKNPINTNELEAHLANFYLNLGTLYNKLERYEEAEKCFVTALEIYNRLIEFNPSAYEPNLVKLYLNLGLLCSDLYRDHEAERYYLASLEIAKRLAEVNPSAFDPVLAHSYCKLGSLYMTLHRFEEAEANSLSALNIREKLAASNPTAFASDLIESSQDLGVFYTLLGRYADAEKHLLSALEIETRLAEKNSDAFMKSLAQTAYSLGRLYSKMNRLDDAEKFFLRAAEIYKRLAESDVIGFRTTLAWLYFFLGSICSDTERKEEAEGYYSQAILIFDSLEDDDSCLNPRATIHDRLACYYHRVRRYDEAEQHYLPAIALYETISKKNSNVLPRLAVCHFELALLHIEHKRYDAAAECLLAAIKLQTVLAEHDPDTYEDILMQQQFMLADIYLETKREQDAEPYFLLAQKICERRYKEDPAKYGRLLAYLLYHRGKIVKSDELVMQGYALAKEYPDDKDCADIVSKYEDSHK